MTMFRHAVARLAAGMILVLVVAGIPAASAPQPASQPSAGDWVKRLGDGHWKVREEAQQQLIALGEQAQTAVLVGLTSPDPEIRARARIIWARITVAAKFTCSGQVNDASGAPVAGAQVVAYSGWQDQAKGHALALIGKCETDARGRFAFNHPLKDGYPVGFIAARAPGRAAGWTGWQSKDDYTLTLTLPKPQSLGGTVVDAKGAPVAGASVRAQLRLPAADGGNTLDSLPPFDWFLARTDERGRFQFDNLPPGAQVAFIAWASGHGRLDQRSSDPWWGWLADAPVLAGKTDVQITLPKEAAIEGKIIDRNTRKPLGGLAVNVTCLQPPAISAADGTFRITSLPGGTCTVALVTPIDETASWVAPPVEVKLATGQTAKDVTLKAVKGGLVEAVITDANDGRPIAGANFLVFPDAPDGHELYQAGWRPVYSGSSNAEGLAVVRLPPGTHSLIAAEKSGEYYTWDLPAKVLAVEEGGRQRIEITLRPLHKTCGRVLDDAGNPVPGAWVTGIRTTGAGLTNAAGEFNFAWQPCNPGQMDLRLLVRHAKRNLAAIVDVPDPDAHVDVRLSPGATVTGLVTDPAGKPLPHALVRADIGLPGGEFTGADARCAMTDADGRYQWRAIPSGQVRLGASARAHGGQSTTITVDSTSPQPVRVPDVVLPPADLCVCGVVKDDAGKPVEGVKVWLQGEGQPGGQSQATTDAHGRFKIEGACKGKALLCARDAKEGRSCSRSFQATGEDVEIILDEPVKGQVGAP